MKFDEDVLGLAVHPNEPLFAVSEVTGHVTAFTFDRSDPGRTKQIWRTKRHKRGCRDLVFSPEGKYLVSVGSDLVIKRADASTGKVLSKAGINAVQYVNEHVFATGDDGGVVKAWDTREPEGRSVREWTQTHDDYISSLTPIDEKFVVATCGDGTLSVHDLRSSKSKPKVSDDQEDDLTSACLVKAHTKQPKLCVGTASGVISLFNKGDWGDCNDRILPSKPKHKKEEAPGVECLLAVDSHRIVSGGSDGKIRMINVLPNSYLRLVGDFENNEPVNAMGLSGNWILAASGAQVLFYTCNEVVSQVQEGDDEVPKPPSENLDDSSDNGKEEDEEFSDSDSDVPKKKPKKQVVKMTQREIEKPKNTFFDDM